MLESVKNSKDLSNRASKVARESANTGIEAIDKLQLINETINHSIQLIEVLNQKSKEINDSVEHISKLSKKTTMIALNASIEAARAGDAGKSFAVVAEEVKRLAEESNNVTKKIIEVTGQINQQTTLANTQIIEKKKQIDSNVESVVFTLSSLESISDITNLTAQKIDEILHDTERQVENLKR